MAQVKERELEVASSNPALLISPNLEQRGLSQISLLKIVWLKFTSVDKENRKCSNAGVHSKFSNVLNMLDVKSVRVSRVNSSLNNAVAGNSSPAAITTRSRSDRSINLLNASLNG